MTLIHILENINSVPKLKFPMEDHARGDKNMSYSCNGIKENAREERTDSDDDATAGLLAQGQSEWLVDLHLDVLGGGRPRVHLQQPPPPAASPVAGRPPRVHQRHPMEAAFS